MQARMKQPVYLIPQALTAMQALNQAVAGRVPETTLGLVHMRASQINGCAMCLAMHTTHYKETDERVLTVAGWRDAPFFTPAERAALALTECVTRLADRADPVPGEVWAEAAKHYDEATLAALLVSISAITTRVESAQRRDATGRRREHMVS